MVIGQNPESGTVIANAKQHGVGIGLSKLAKRSFEIAMNQVKFQNAP